MSGEFDRFLKEHGTQRQHTTTQTPEQNGVVEHANRDIGEGIKAMLQSGVPHSFWAPYELFHGKKLCLSPACVGMCGLCACAEEAAYPQLGTSLSEVRVHWLP